MSDYIFKYTNQTSASFVVKPYTANGPASPSVTTPYVNSVSGIHAFSINTPFVLVGKGVTDYGQTVQNNILYLAENFCNPTRPQPPMTGMLWYKSAHGADAANPTDPTVAGMYMWDGTIWNKILVNGKITSNVNLSGYRLTNVGDAVDASDALNTTTANGLYLSLTGGTLSGNLVLAPTRTVKVSTVPIASEDVTNKLYVDAADLILQNSIDDVADNLTAEVTSINGQIATLYPKTGGQISGNVTITGNLTLSATSNLTLTSGSGVVDFADHVLQNLGDPVLAHDAVHKAYVDTTIATEIANLTIPPASQADGVVSAVALDESTGALTLTRTQGLPPLVATGSFAERSHTHDASVINYDASQNQQNSALATVAGTPNTTVELAIVRLDRLVSTTNLNPMRTVIQQTSAANTTFTFADQYTYDVWSDRLMLFVNGIKQYCDTRAEVYVPIDGRGGYSPVGVAAGTYPINLTVDSIPQVAHVDVVTNMMYRELITAIQQSLTNAAIPVSCVYQQFDEDAIFTFVHNESGSGHDVTMTIAIGDLFDVIAEAGTPVAETGATYAYREVGIAGDTSVEVEFHTPPPLNAFIEIITFA